MDPLLIALRTMLARVSVTITLMLLTQALATLHRREGASDYLRTLIMPVSQPPTVK